MTKVLLFLFEVLFFKICVYISNMWMWIWQLFMQWDSFKSGGKNKYVTNNDNKMYFEIKMCYVYETATDIAAIIIFL